MLLNRKNVGAKIAAWRKENKISQSQLAQQIGVNRTTLSLWESGKQLPQPAQLETLAKCIGVPVEALSVSRKSAKALAREVIADINGTEAQRGLKVMFGGSDVIQDLCEALGKLQQSVPESDVEALQLGKAYIAFNQIVSNALADRDIERGEAEED